MKQFFSLTFLFCFLQGAVFAEAPASKENALRTETKNIANSSKYPGAPSFEFSASDINKLASASKETLDAKLEKIVKIQASQRTFENTVLAFETALSEYSDQVNIPTFLAQVGESAEVREAGNQLEEAVNAYMVEIQTRRDLFNAINEFAKEKAQLQPDEAFLLERTLSDFKRNGLALSDKELAEYKELKKKLVSLELKFEKNVRDFKDELHISKEGLDGLPADYIEKLKKTASGEYIITLDYPDYYPFMDNAKNEELRRQLEYKFNNRCASENVQIMEEALQLRDKLAKMLGFKNHAEYMLDDKMAKKPENVNQFLDKLVERLTPKAKDEIKARLELKAKETGKPVEDVLKLWDFRYLNNLYRKVNCDIDQEKVKEYFPLDIVVPEMLKIFEEIFNVKFQKADLPVWHPDVTGFKLTEKNGGLIGYFYLDLFPREGKYKHMACFGIVRGRLLPDGTYQKPAAAIVGNFPKPVGKTPALLPHNDVETLFHEFGHVTHNLFSTAKYASLAGTSVERDFVEAPSTLLENFVWKPEVLKRISGNYKNPSEKIPDELVKKLIEGKNCDSGLTFLRQLFFSKLDMVIHTDKLNDTTETYKKLMPEVMLSPMSEGTHPQASFGHLMGGYDAGYYGYLWARAISSDLFSVFDKYGVIDPKTGEIYRKLILSVGRSPDQMAQVEKFLGRKFSEDAFLKNYGITK
ncbi:MAG: Zn-dependent oligopeptidase [Candidatus Riflebacteria bacterium]|nr:Zn-dependent oligopeptidase [Candidatus Riflebacteria bacterium]